jgi:hypothetical protein
VVRRRTTCVTSAVQEARASAAGAVVAVVEVPRLASLDPLAAAGTVDGAGGDVGREVPAPRFVSVAVASAVA